MKWIAIGFTLFLLIALEELGVMTLHRFQRLAAVAFVVWLVVLVLQQIGSFPAFQGYWIHGYLAVSVLAMICDRVYHFRSKSNQS